MHGTGSTRAKLAGASAAAPRQVREFVGVDATRVVAGCLHTFLPGRVIMRSIMLRHFHPLLRRAGFLFLLASSALTAISCKHPSSLPGTEIPNTPEARAVLEVVEKYRISFLRKDAPAVWALAHTSYHDQAGTDDPTDDVDFNSLGPLLRTRLAQIDTLRFAIDYVSLRVERDRAILRVWIDASYRMKPILGPDGRPREQSNYETQQDFAEFELVHDKDLWRFVRGL